MFADVAEAYEVDAGITRGVAWSVFMSWISLRTSAIAEAWASIAAAFWAARALMASKIAENGGSLTITCWGFGVTFLAFFSSFERWASR